MRPKHRIVVAIAAVPLLLGAATLAARTGETAGAPHAAAPAARAATLQHHPRLILDAVARRMGITLRPDIPLPAILLESRTPLERMQAAAEAQWGFRPAVFVSAYSIARNEIYLIDEATCYLPRDRTLDDALAHELVHYLQANYLRDRLDTDWSESQAVAIQTWIREQLASADR